MGLGPHRSAGMEYEQAPEGTSDTRTSILAERYSGCQ